MEECFLALSSHQHELSASDLGGFVFVFILAFIAGIGCNLKAILIYFLLWLKMSKISLSVFYLLYLL